MKSLEWKITKEYKYIEFIVQEPQLGTGHAVMQTNNLLSKYTGDVLVLMGDAPLISSDALNEFIRYHKNNNFVSSLMTKDYNGYGCAKVLRDNNGKFIKTIECSDIGNNDNIKKITEVAVGVSIYKSKELFNTLTKVSNNNAQEEYYLPDVIKINIDEGLTIGALKSSKIGTVHSCNTMESLKNIEKIIISADL